MKNECSIIRDLLPLYIEKMVSPDTANYLKEHLETCPQCTTELEALSKFNNVDRIAEDKNIDNDIAAFKIVKQKFRRKRILTILTSIILTLAVVFSCINFWPVMVFYGYSEVYSKKDMDSAIELIKENFNHREGYKLYSITYTNDSLCTEELEYCNILSNDNVTYSECIVFRVKFRSPIFGEDPTLNANFIYDWDWYLARTEGGNWEIITYGAP